MKRLFNIINLIKLIHRINTLLERARTININNTASPIINRYFRNLTNISIICILSKIIAYGKHVSFDFDPSHRICYVHKYHRRKIFIKCALCLQRLSIFFQLWYEHIR